jgi:hypothetical protein
MGISLAPKETPTVIPLWIGAPAISLSPARGAAKQGARKKPDSESTGKILSGANPGRSFVNTHQKAKVELRISPILAFLSALALFTVACGFAATLVPLNPYADYFADIPMIHQEVTAIVDGEEKPLRLREVNLGGWLHRERWDFSKGADISDNKIDAGLASLVGQDAVDRFHERMYENFISEADIRAIAGFGFHSVRLPINYSVLEDNGRPYVYKDSGWELIGRALDWCETHGVYVILDLHAAPGGQSGLPPSNPNSGEPKVWHSEENAKRTVALWQAIAGRYKDRTIVAGYDLLNEHLPPKENPLVGLYQWLVGPYAGSTPTTW